MVKYLRKRLRLQFRFISLDAYLKSSPVSFVPNLPIRHIDILVCAHVIYNVLRERLYCLRVQPYIYCLGMLADSYMSGYDWEWNIDPQMF